MKEENNSSRVECVGVYGCIVLYSELMHEERLLPALQQDHGAHPCLCFQGALGDQEDLGDREDQQVQPGPGHP